MARRTNRYRIGEKSTDVRVGYLGGQPALIANWGGRKYGAPLSLTGSGNSSRDSNFGNIRVKGDAVFDSGASVLRVKGDGISIRESNTEVASFGSNIIVGQVAAGQSNVLISSGALKLRNNTTDMITLASDGSATISGDVTIGGTSLTTTADNVVIGDTDTGSTLVTHAQTVENVLIGSETAKTTTYGKYNVFIGYRAGMNWSGVQGSASARYGNIGIGHLALQCASTSAIGNDNIAIGRSTLTYWAGTTGGSNTCIGPLAGEGSGGNPVTGSHNVLIGHNAGNNSGSGNIESGSNNICISAASGTSNTSAITNAANTNYAISIGFATKAGTNAIAIGKGTDSDLVTASGTDSIAIGSISDATGAQSIAIGEGAQATAAAAISIGDGSTASAADGIAIGRGNTVDDANSIAIGYSNDISGNHSHNIVIGDDNETASDHSIVIGNSLGLVDSYDHYLFMGKDTTSDTYIYVNYISDTAFTNPSDRRIKKDITYEGIGLDFINDLKPCTFNFKAPSEMDESYGGYNKDNDSPKTDRKQYGLIAQEVKESIDKYNALDYFHMWSIAPNGYTEGIARGMLVMPLLKAVQELSEKLDSIDTRLTNLEAA